MKLKIFSASILLIAFMSIAIPALAMTTQERDALISSLQAQITLLTQQITGLLIQQQGEQQQSTGDWCHTFNSNLGYAQSGTQEVIYLHTVLDREGIFYAPDTGTTYGEMTMEAIVVFQGRYGISPQSGWTGSLTRAKLNQLYGCAVVNIPITSTIPITPTTPIAPVTPIVPITPTITPIVPITPTITIAPVAPIVPVTPIAPIAPVTPTTTCVPDWACSDWLSCVVDQKTLIGQQTRACENLNSCSAGYCSPITERPCGYGTYYLEYDYKFAPLRSALSATYRESRGEQISVVTPPYPIYKGNFVTFFWNVESWGSLGTPRTFSVILEKGGEIFEPFPFLCTKVYRNPPYTGRCNWQVPINTVDGDVFPEGDDYSFRLVGEMGNRILGRSGNFTITSRPYITPSDLEIPFFEIISPNGGETFEQGETIMIEWRTNITESLGLYLDIRDLYTGRLLNVNRNVSSAMLNTNLASGSYSYTIPASMQSGKDRYKIYASVNRYTPIAVSFPSFTSEKVSGDISNAFSVNNSYYSCPIPKQLP